jgi:glucosamine-6-phosphate deaminase
VKIYTEKDYNTLSEKAAEIIADFVEKNPRCVLGLATGSTPVGAYDLLGKMCQNGRISFENVVTFNLDEYSGLSSENQQSYRFFMKKNFFDKINIDLKNAFFPTDFAPNYENYDKKIDECHGIDLQILGIGRNGHIGFNEPGSDFLSKTREIKLTETTIKDNSRFFDKIENVPKTAVTMGISTIMKAKKIILLASGEGKKEIIKKALFGPVMQEVPASVLQRHKDVIVILDKEAALGL